MAKRGLQTGLIRDGIERTGFQETSEALFMTSGYVYGSAEEAEAAFKGERQSYIYSRYANPTVAIFERKLAALEGADACRATASGMAAVFTAMACQLKAGDRVVASKALFGSCQFIIAEILPGWGVETVFVDGTDLSQWGQALAKPTKIVFLETPSNPMLEVIDLPAVCNLAHKAGARVIVDNVFATPLLQRPLELGADIVTYSATKHIDGQGRCLGGAILGSQEFIADELTPFFRHTGPSMSPFNAWVLLKGLETLKLRVMHQSDSAMKIAEFLEGKKEVELVRYPFLKSHPHMETARRQMKAGGTMISFILKDGKDATFRFMNALNLVDISNNLGDAKSLITHPSTTTHQRLKEEERLELGITPGTVRFSVGLEDAEDLIADLDQALSRA